MDILFWRFHKQIISPLRLRSVLPVLAALPQRLALAGWMMHNTRSGNPHVSRNSSSSYVCNHPRFRRYFCRHLPGCRETPADEGTYCSSLAPASLIAISQQLPRWPPGVLAADPAPIRYMPALADQQLQRLSPWPGMHSLHSLALSLGSPTVLPVQGFLCRDFLRLSDLPDLLYRHVRRDRFQLFIIQP